MFDVKYQNIRESATKLYHVLPWLGKKILFWKCWNYLNSFFCKTFKKTKKITQQQDTRYKIICEFCLWIVDWELCKYFGTHIIIMWIFVRRILFVICDTYKKTATKWKPFLTLKLSSSCHRLLSHPFGFVKFYKSDSWLNSCSMEILTPVD